MVPILRLVIIEPGEEADHRELLTVLSYLHILCDKTRGRAVDRQTIFKEFG